MAQVNYTKHSIIPPHETHTGPGSVHTGAHTDYARIPKSYLAGFGRRYRFAKVEPTVIGSDLDCSMPLLQMLSLDER